MKFLLALAVPPLLAVGATLALPRPTALALALQEFPLTAEVVPAVRAAPPTAALLEFRLAADAVPPPPAVHVELTGTAVAADLAVLLPNVGPAADAAQEKTAQDAKLLSNTALTIRCTNITR